MGSSRRISSRSSGTWSRGSSSGRTSTIRSAEFHYDQVGPALDEVKAKAKFRLLSRFHNLLQASTSHYTLDGDPSERLMLKYYEYLLRTRDLALKQFGISDPRQP